ncbi:hypothetical protein V6N13_098494 [Hibiscus sabdariffa]
MNWRKLFEGEEDQSLQFFQPTTQDGETLIDPPSVVFDTGIRTWQTSLVAKDCLSYIASALGNLLYMDTSTTKRHRLAFAKVCVEVSADFKIPRTIPVKLRNGIVVSAGVVVPWILALCFHCGVFVHADKSCQHVEPSKIWVPKQSVVGEVKKFPTPSGPCNVIQSIEPGGFLLAVLEALEITIVMVDLQLDVEMFTSVTGQT